MIKGSFILLLLSVFGGLFYNNSNRLLKQSEYVIYTLSEMGDTQPLHFISELDMDKVNKGKQLVLEGKTIGPNGKMTQVQSKYFVCTDCHNVTNEEKDLSKPNPEDRLDYCLEKGIPFLQGTTLYGVVNRETWYNDDYLKKYGDLVAPSRDTLENAIQLCATQCSQGRELEDWEMEAVLHYLHSISYRVSDLKIDENEINGKTNQETIDILKSKYAVKSPATFMNPKTIGSREYGAKGDADNGAKIYEISCLHCHKDRGVSNYILDNEKTTFKSLKKHLGLDVNQSVYYIARKGTYAINGYKPYMPNYTQERLSDQQLEDLVAYINKMATK